MTNTPSLPEIGRIVEVTRGRERSAHAVVVGHSTGRSVLLADGDKRKVDKPKKKNVLHIQASGHSVTDFLNHVQVGGKLTNALIRHVLRQYAKSKQGSNESVEEGGEPHGQG